MRVTILGSGSAGNAILVTTTEACVLVDAGFSGRDLERRLAIAGIEPERIDALLVTHDHIDHTRGMGIFARRWGTPLYLTERTRSACARLLNGREDVRLYSSEQPVELADLLITPFLTVHDAVDPVAVTVTALTGGEKLGVATDLGRPTAAVRHALQACDLLVLESNHDEILLRESPYPWSVKSRIASSHGHLSNRAAAELACELIHDRLECVVLAHLSENANDPGIALDTVGEALAKRRYGGDLLVAPQDVPLPTLDLAEMRSRRLPPQLAFL